MVCIQDIVQGCSLIRKCTAGTALHCTFSCVDPCPLPKESSSSGFLVSVECYFFLDVFLVLRMKNEKLSNKSKNALPEQIDIPQPLTMKNLYLFLPKHSTSWVWHRTNILFT